jgi:hypothetical protein
LNSMKIFINIWRIFFIIFFHGIPGRSVEFYETEVDGIPWNFVNWRNLMEFGFYRDILLVIKPHMVHWTLNKKFKFKFKKKTCD